jgi:hypothetical protein
MHAMRLNWDGRLSRVDGYLFIGGGCHQLSESSGCLLTLAYVWYYLYSGPKGALYVQVLSKGYFKKYYTSMWSRICPCTICRAYVRWSSHVCVMPPNLASVNLVESLGIYPFKPTCHQMGNQSYKNVRANEKGGE